MKIIARKAKILAGVAAELRRLEKTLRRLSELAQGELRVLFLMLADRLGEIIRTIESIEPGAGDRSSS
jgi:hypothetical protein